MRKLHQTLKNSLTMKLNLVQIVYILTLINSSIANIKLTNDNSDLSKINRINKINKKLDLIDEEAINQNQIQLIDALEQDTFLPHQTVTINWSSDTKTTTKTKLSNDDKVNESRPKYSTDSVLKEDSKLDSINNVHIKDIENIKDDNIHDYLHSNLYHLEDEGELEEEENKANLHFVMPRESIAKFDLPNKGLKFNGKKNRQKFWKEKDSKLMDSNLMQTTSSIPYIPFSTLSSSSSVHSSSHSSSGPKTTTSDLKQTLSNLLNKEKDTTKYTINTYSSVSYNYPHHHLQYKQININPNNQTLNTILPFTFSLTDRLTTTTFNDNNDKLTKFLNLINKEENEQNDIKLNNKKESDDLKLNDKNRDDLFTTPISIDNLDNLFDKSTNLHKLISRTSRHTNQNYQHNYQPMSNSPDQLEHHQLLSNLNFDPKSLLESRGQNKAKNQVELRFNNTEIIKINWPVKKIVDLAGDISLGGLMMIHERDENYTCGAIMPQGGIQVSVVYS